MHSVSYIQSVHLGTGNTNRDPGVSIVTVRRLDADRGPPEHLAMHSAPAPFIYSRAPITSAGRFSPRGPRGAISSANTKISRPENRFCLLYTSDAADDLLCVHLGGRR